MLEPSPESPQDRRRFHLLALVSVLLAMASLAWAVYEHGWSALGRISGVAGSAQLIGKWLIFVGAREDNWTGMGPWTISYTIFLLDLLLALVLNSFLPQLERLPYLGPWLVKTRHKASAAYAEYPKLRRMAWSGVALWVFLPLPASGAVTGSFASRLVGLSRTSAVTATAFGSLTNGILFAALAMWLGANAEELLRNWKVTAGCAIVLLALTWWGWRRLVRMLREEH